MTSSPVPSSAPSDRERSLAIISAWVLNAGVLPASVLPDTTDELVDLAIDLGLMAAALLNAWAVDIGTTPTKLLSDIALGQAVNGVTRDAIDK